MAKTGPYVRLQSVSVGPAGKTLTLGLGAGDRFAVIGRSGSGVSELLAVAAGKQAPFAGTAEFVGRPHLASSVRLGIRTTPASLAKADGTTRAAGVLSLLGLWDVRSTPCPRLPSSMQAACRLVPALMASEGLWVFDGELDQVDLRVATDVCAEMAEPSERNKAFLVGTNSPSVVEALGRVVVMRQQGAVFAGTVQELVQQCRPSEVTVEAGDPGAVTAMADPFALSVSVEGGTTRFVSHDGQALAARLLTEGYGSVRSVVVSQPNVAQALLELL